MTSFMLNRLENRYIRDQVLSRSSMHGSQHAYICIDYQVGGGDLCRKTSDGDIY